MTEQAPTTTTSQKPRLRYLGGTRFLVESKGEPGLGRQVDTLTLRCSCPAGSYGRRCRHLVLALAYEEWRRQEEAKARAARKAEGVQAANWSSAPAAVAPPVATAAPVTSQEQAHEAAQVPWHESAGYRALASAFE